MSSKVLEFFEQQAQACDDMGSPFTAKLCRAAIRALDDSTQTGKCILSWAGDPHLDALPLRLCGGLRHLALSGADSDWAALYPPRAAADAALNAALGEVLKRHDAFLNRFLDSPPQTNESARSSMLLPGFLEIARRAKLPLALVEIGSSAGLNLFPDRYGYRYGDAEWGDPAFPTPIIPEMRGGQPDLSGDLLIAGRSGSDIAPLNIRGAADRMRLRAYIWPDQTARLARLDAAISVAEKGGFSITRADAPDFVAAKLALRETGTCLVLFHSMLWHYLPDASKEKISGLLETAGAPANAESPLAWLRMEELPGILGQSSLQLTIWPKGETRVLAQCDAHGRWMEWLG